MKKKKKKAWYLQEPGAIRTLPTTLRGNIKERPHVSGEPFGSR